MSSLRRLVVLSVVLSIAGHRLFAQECLVENGLPSATAIHPSPRITDIDSSDKVRYQAQSGIEYVLNQFSGRHVALLLPDEWIGPAGLSVDERRTLLDRLDWVYELYTTIVGGEPAGEGLLPIYVVRVIGATGRGRIASKWVEISSDSAILGLTKQDLRDSGLPTDIYIHEMAHNFDLFESYLGYGDDPVHTWTALLISIAQIYGRSGRAPDNVPGWIMDQLRRTYQEYLNDPRATWASCVRSGSLCTIGSGLGVIGAGAWIAVTMRVADLHGINAMPSFMAAVRQLAAQRPFPFTPEEKEDLHIEALAAAAQQDLGCYADFWRWQASSALRDRMRTAYGHNAFCDDRDSDGFSPLAGDTDDGNPAVHPRATEVLNGIDDDCDGTIDNLLYTEPEGGDFPQPFSVHFPARIVGTISTSNDVDAFEFQLPSAQDVRLSLQPLSTFSFEVEIAGSSGSVVTTIPGIGDRRVTLTAGVWTIRVRAMTLPAGLPNPGGRYEVNLLPAEPKGTQWGSVAPPILIGGSMRFTSTTHTLEGALQQPTEVRFWVSKIGFVGSSPYSPTATFDWSLPLDLAPGTYGYRAQAYAGSTPVTDLSPPVWFNTQRPKRRHAAGR